MARLYQFDVCGTGHRVVLDHHCEACCHRLQIKSNSKLEKILADEREQNKSAREATWQKLCPIEFREVKEGGETSLVRILKEQPAASKVLDWPAGKSLIIRGNTGKCKTRVMWRLLRKRFEAGKFFIALTAGEFDRQCRDAGGNFYLERWFLKMALVDILFIDDLGKGEWTPATEAQWFDLCDKRLREHRPIFITTQEDGSSLHAKMSKNSEVRSLALIRRLRDFCETVIFT